MGDIAGKRIMNGANCVGRENDVGVSIVSGGTNTNTGGARNGTGTIVTMTEISQIPRMGFIARSCCPIRSQDEIACTFGRIPLPCGSPPWRLVSDARGILIGIRNDLLA